MVWGVSEWCVVCIGKVERHRTLRFDPCNRFLKFRESTGTPSPKVGVALGV